MDGAGKNFLCYSTPLTPNLQQFSAVRRFGFRKVQSFIRKQERNSGFRIKTVQAAGTAGTAGISEPYRALPIWGCGMLKLFIAGQKSFGAAVYKAVQNAGHTVTGVACPADGQYYDRLKKAACCDKSKPVIIDSDKLRSSDIPEGTDVIIAAHSHHFISTKACEKVRYAFGCHPSLLPRHRGKDAVKWTIRFGDTIAGGSIYELGEKVDGGAIVLQRSVLVKKEE